MERTAINVVASRSEIGTKLQILLLFILPAIAGVGCRTTAPIHVWEPASVGAPAFAKVALMPIAGAPELANRIERAILHQRPAARADVALFTADQLAQTSPVRLASTAYMNSDILALEAAKAMDANILVHGEILAADLDFSDPEEPTENVDWNRAFFQKRKAAESDKQELLMLSWRIIDSESRTTLGSSSFTLRTQEAQQRYPDLAMLYPDDNTSLLIAASARETWKLLSPTVVNDRVQLAKPWLQPGAWQVRRGVSAAKRGEWQVAESHFQKAADRFKFNAAAQHNLAVALAAREDFSGAKERLMKATGPFAFRLPNDTLFWLDSKHRKYHEAHGIAKPTEGWAFPEPNENQPLIDAPPIDIADLPWWTAIPFTKIPQQ